ncbi:hypothetical protein MPSI1_000103 [Malassezia psittaci]|uniref:NFACT RNA-binding domain-containing protein n=1 Tax=Malassezia psittaci TaxID=1821823 RepID=A0AAF0JCQ0_9BASI|nr:hypothetical protein MPSI1_000103 [Malassezia psittaci]
MVRFFESNAIEPCAVIYMGKDKVENEELLKHGLPEDVWFHVDKLSSAHVYLRLPEQIASWTEIPEALLEDCAQLVKANSIEGNKKNNLTVIYTPHSNVKQKTGDMAVGAVSFHNDRLVKRYFVKERKNAIVNRLNKTLNERQVDYDAERQERERSLGRKKKEHAQAQNYSKPSGDIKKKPLLVTIPIVCMHELTRVYSEEAVAEQHRIDQRRARIKAAQGDDEEGDESSDDSFM